MIFTLLVIALLTILIWYNIVKHNYWSNKGVYSPPALPVIGHTHRALGYTWEYQDDVYKKAKKFGISGAYEFFSPKLCVYSPDLIKSVMVKDFDHFVDRRRFSNTSKNDKFFTDMLTSVSGERWKFFRTILTPSFTSGKLKGMFPLVSDIADELTTFCKESSKDGSVVEMHDAIGRYALDVIACVAFGIEGKTIQQGESEFYKLMKSFSTFSYFAILKFLMFILSPRLFNLLGLSFFTEKTGELVTIVKNTLEQRRKGGTRRGDFVDLILEANENAEKSEVQKFEFNEDSMIAQSMLFLLAGYDTITNTSAFLLNDLAKYPEEQRRVREELAELAQDGELNYQKIMEAKYLDAFICESMRLTPSAYVTERSCTKNYVLPGTEITVPKDQIVSIPIWSLHRDPAYWEDPLEFRASRFLPENKEEIVPYTYLPFGLGPRNCIGNRLALMEMKLAVAKLILSFEMSHPPGFEMKLKKSPQALRPDANGVKLILKPIDKE